MERIWPFVQLRACRPMRKPPPEGGGPRASARGFLQGQDLPTNYALREFEVAKNCRKPRLYFMSWHVGGCRLSTSPAGAAVSGENLALVGLPVAGLAIAGGASGIADGMLAADMAT